MIRKPFKVEVTREWCERMAALEESHEVGAGGLPVLPSSVKRYRPGAYGAMVEDEDGKYIHVDDLVAALRHPPLAREEEIQDHNAALTAGVTDLGGAAPREACVWLIEARWSSAPLYWSGRSGQFDCRQDRDAFDPDVNWAVRFARRQDAEQVRGWVIHPAVRDLCASVEHLWYSSEKETDGNQGTGSEASVRNRGSEAQ